MKLGWRNIQGSIYGSGGGYWSGVLGFLTLLVSQKAKPEGRHGAGWVAARPGLAGTLCVGGKPRGMVRSQRGPGS